MKKQSANQKFRPNLQNLPLVEYYNSLEEVRRVPKGTLTERLAFLQAVSKTVGKPVSTLRRWVSGSVQPTHLERSAIAKLLKCDVECLFPASHDQH